MDTFASWVAVLTIVALFTKILPYRIRFSFVLKNYKISYGGQISQKLPVRKVALVLAFISINVREVCAQLFNVVQKQGVTVPIAGRGAASYTGDGGAALFAGLNAPRSVAIDGEGNLKIPHFMGISSFFFIPYLSIAPV